ncbi:MAG: GspH/FimT family pseudopilin [Pseudomonadota bacterium]
MLRLTHSGINSETNGFSLIECMVACAVFAILSLLAMPSFSSAIRDAQVRTAAQSLIGSLQLARAESIRRNGPVMLVLKNELGGATKPGGTDWTILADDQKTPGVPNYTVEVQKRSGLEGSPQARVGARTTNDFATTAMPGANLPAAITFTSLGRLAMPPGTSSAPILQIDVVHAQSTDARRLSISLTPGGQIRLCDPAVALAANPQGCA